MRRILLGIVALGTGAVLGALSPTWAVFSSGTDNAVNTFAAAESFCVAPGTVTVIADRDATVDEQRFNRNAGTETTLEVRSWTHVNQDRNRRTLLGFSLPVTPKHCTVTAAELRLNATSAVPGRTLEAVRVDGAWTEAAVTWNTQPPSAGAASTALGAPGWVAFDVTSQIQASYSGTDHGLLVRDAAEGSPVALEQVFSSREGASPPELDVTFG